MSGPAGRPAGGRIELLPHPPARMRLPRLVLAFSLLLPWCVPAQSAAPAAAPEAAPAATQPAATPPARNFLWEVTSLTNRIYLYGTIHAGKASFYPLPPAVQGAFADAQVLAVEADITDEESMRRNAGTMTYAPPDTLAKHVPEKTYERFRHILDRFGVPEAQMAPIKPFYAGSLLAMLQWGRMGYLPEQGVDLHLIKLAKSKGKRVVELEGADAQSELMDSISESDAVQSFEGAVETVENGQVRDLVTGMMNAWQSGDPALLLDVVHGYNKAIPGAEALEEKFIWSRHPAMLRKIQSWLDTGNERVFVAVGALHLAGPRGLVAELKKRGYTVRQL